jgi:hypothetical protein
MKKFADDTNETEKLTDAIRKLGTPYVSDEPDSVYWANFRVRVMDRIAEGESKTALAWPERIREFIASHVLGTSVSVATLALFITLAALLNPIGGNQSQTQQIAAVTPKSAAAREFAPEQQAQVKEPASAPAVKSEPVASNILHGHSIARNGQPEKTEDLASLNSTENESVAGVQVLTATDADNPVSLDELSDAQLEGLLKSMDDSEQNSAE